MVSDYDENTINRGTLGRPKPLLKFHSVCGTNIRLLRDGRVARRRESFCKGLAFSNRPISIDEIVCIRLCEVGTNWSGVMRGKTLRFGVTNVDPASFRDIELPKFACPDLTSKGGYWAKSLAERYSIENSILHFFVNETGEMYYGVNGVHKGLFLSGINVLSPLWIIVDIYGNSIAVEFVDPAEVQLQRKTPSKPRAVQSALICAETTSTESSPVPAVRNLQQQTAGMTGSISANNLLTTATTSRSPSMTNNPKMRFHNVKGNNVTLQHDDTVAIRRHGEYYLGYVFTERPIRIGEKLIVLVSMTEDAFSGSLAFGLTSCDPTQVPASRLPADSDELLERPEYWVCIKDVGAMPQVGDKLSFQVDAAGRVLFSKNDAPSRVIMHVDVSIPLWAFFDLYGSTRKIQILDLDLPLSSSLGISDLSRSFRASSEGACSHTAVDRSASSQTAQQARLNRPSSTQWNMDSLRVALPAESSALSTTPPIHHHQQQPEAVALPVSSSSADTSGASLSAPSSSAPFSLGIDSAELARIRASITMRRLNQQQQALSGELAAASSATNTSTAAANESRLSERPLPSLRERPLPTLDELLSRRRSRETQSPGRYMGAGLSQHLFESPVTTNSGASITVPLLPPPLFSSLDVSPLEARGEQQNRRNRAAEFEAFHRSSDSDNSPNRPTDEAQPTTDEDRSNECSICMSNRVNAVIYRCGHMCMCFPCAKETHRRSGDCPICRTPIIDVIRCYPV